MKIEALRDFSPDICAICGESTVKKQLFGLYSECINHHWHRYCVDSGSVGLYFYFDRSTYCFEYKHEQHKTIFWRQLDPDSNWEKMIEDLPFVLPEQINSLEKAEKKIQTLMNFS